MAHVLRFQEAEVHLTDSAVKSNSSRGSFPKDFRRPWKASLRVLRSEVFPWRAPLGRLLGRLLLEGSEYPLEGFLWRVPLERLLVRAPLVGLFLEDSL